MHSSEIVRFLNSKGFIITLHQAGPPGLLCSPGDREFQWYGNIYSQDRHREFANKRNSYSYEELQKLECFHYQLVTHRQPTMEAALFALFREYHKPTLPPRATRTSFNPAFARHKKEKARPVTDDDLLA